MSWPIFLALGTTTSKYNRWRRGSGPNWETRLDLGARVGSWAGRKAAGGREVGEGSTSMAETLAWEGEGSTSMEEA